MNTVLLTEGTKTLPGWNESVEEGEDPSYCTWEDWYPNDPYYDPEITHWMPLPEPPE